jgi:hypothetical protein
MCQIGSILARCRSAANLVTKDTGIVQKDLLAMLPRFIGRRRGRLELSLEPRIKLVFRLGDHPYRHVRVLEPAELGTLPAIDAGMIGLDPFGSGSRRDQVALAV